MYRKKAEGRVGGGGGGNFINAIENHTERKLIKGGNVNTLRIRVLHTLPQR